MLLYLDNSFLNRPFDNPEVGTNRLEGEMLSLVVKLIDIGKVRIINSAAIEYENSLNPMPERKIFVEEVLKKAKYYQDIDDNIKKRANNLIEMFNISSIDALHLASAEKTNADLFVTCDYGIIRKYKGRVKVIIPLEFIQYYEHANK